MPSYPSPTEPDPRHRSHLKGRSTPPRPAKSPPAPSNTPSQLRISPIVHVLDPPAPSAAPSPYLKANRHALSALASPESTLALTALPPIRPTTTVYRHQHQRPPVQRATAPSPPIAFLGLATGPATPLTVEPPLSAPRSSATHRNHDYYFEWGATEAYGHTATAGHRAPDPTVPPKPLRSLTGLSPDTTYHYRVVAKNDRRRRPRQRRRPSSSPPPPTRP